MEKSETSNGPTVFSADEGGESEVYYKQKCKYLETQLEKFRDQATKVREVISQKVCMWFQFFMPSFCSFIELFASVVFVAK